MINAQNLAAKENYQFQKIVAVVGVLLFVIKFIAWYITDSVAVLTDALESVINVVSGFIGLYSLYLSSLPRDENHPYGHGKVEFISASIEGTLISVAGVVIIYEAILNLQHPKVISSLDYGIYLIAVTAVVNYIVGMIAVKKGKKNNLPIYESENPIFLALYNTSKLSLFSLITSSIFTMFEILFKNNLSIFVIS